MLARQDTDGGAQAPGALCVPRLAAWSHGRLLAVRVLQGQERWLRGLWEEGCPWGAMPSQGTMQTGVLDSDLGKGSLSPSNLPLMEPEP